METRSCLPRLCWNVLNFEGITGNKCRKNLHDLFIYYHSDIFRHLDFTSLVG